jgi:anti-sigma factor RsiW
MTCQELLHSLDLADYLTGEAREAICAEIEQHLARCPDCTVRVDALRKTITLYRRYGRRSLPEGVEYRLFRVLHLDDFLSSPPG